MASMSMTKSELLEEAQTLGLDVDDSMTKEQLVEMINNTEVSATGGEAPPEIPFAPVNDPMVCVNCDRPAEYRTTGTGVNQVSYCREHGLNSGEPMEPIHPEEQEEE